MSSSSDSATSVCVAWATANDGTREGNSATERSGTGCVARSVTRSVSVIRLLGKNWRGGGGAKSPAVVEAWWAAVWKTGESENEEAAAGNQAAAAGTEEGAEWDEGTGTDSIS